MRKLLTILLCLISTSIFAQTVTVTNPQIVLPTNSININCYPSNFTGAITVTWTNVSTYQEANYSLTLSGTNSNLLQVSNIPHQGTYYFNCSVTDGTHTVNTLATLMVESMQPLPVGNIHDSVIS